MLTPIINYRRPNVSQGIPIGYWYAKGGPASTLDSPLEKWGCTDPKATNYDIRATKDDGSCTYKTTIDADHAPTSAPEPVAVYGCTDPKAKNYDSKANKDDGSCTYYDATPTVTQQPSEPLTILGCTDPKATNYDSRATKNDGSCKYPDTVIKIDSGGGYGGGGFGGGMPSEEELASAPSKPKNKLVALILLAGLAYVGFKILKR